MASSSSGSPPSHPVPEAVQVLVAALADDSFLVREASAASLKNIAAKDPLLVLECCFSVARGGRRRFGNVAGVFQVMAFAVQAIEKKDLEQSLMSKLAKFGTSEMITSKDFGSDWQRAAANLLVAIGVRMPDLMMEEVFLHLSGSNTAAPAMVQILADFAVSEALQFTLQIKSVLARVLPILGSVKDLHKPIFANAFKCWCQAAWQYSKDFPSDPLFDNDVVSFLNSAFDLLLRVWANSRDLKVRVASVEALGQMAGLVSRSQLKSSLPRITPTILGLYRKDHEIAFIATCSLHHLLNASLLSESGPPLLDFEDLTSVLFALLPVACIYNHNDDRSDFSTGLKTYNEVQRCFLIVGTVYAEDLFTYLLNQCKSKEEHFTFGALCVLKHLLPRLSESWHGKQLLLVETVKSLFDEQSLAVRKGVAELIVVMASHCYLFGPSGEHFVEYLVRNCSISDEEISAFENSRESAKSSGGFQRLQYKKLEVWIGARGPSELRRICEKGLLLLSVTIPEMEHVLWPFILKMVILRKYTQAVATVCRCISELCRRRSFFTTVTLDECRARDDIPKPEELLARLVILLHNPLGREQLTTQILSVLWHLTPLFPQNIGLYWKDEIPKMKAYVSDPEDLKQDSSYQDVWDDMIVNFLAESLDVVEDSEWIVTLGNTFAEQYGLYVDDHEHSALLHRCLGILLQKVDDQNYVQEKIDWMYKHASIPVPLNRLGLAKGIGLVAASHLDTVLEMLKKILDNIGQSIFQRFFSFFYAGVNSNDADDVHAALALMYGYAARYAPSTVIEARIDALVGTNMLSRLLHVQSPMAKQAVITAIDLLGHAVISAGESGVSFPLKKRDVMLDYVLTLMGRDDSDDDEDFSVSNLELHTQTLALSACTTLVSVEPKLTPETRNHVMKATLGFFSLPNEPSAVVDPLINNLILLLSAILMTSGEDGRSRAEQLLHILRRIDPFVASSAEHQRRRGCVAAHELLLKFRVLCSSGKCGLGCHAACPHRKMDKSLIRSSSNLPAIFLLPSRESLNLGERVIVYLPRCADSGTEIRKISAQILDLFFSISLSLPRPAGFSVGPEIEKLYGALSSLEDAIAFLKSDASIDPSEVFNRIVSSVCTLLTRDELTITLYGCSSSICDKVRQSGEGSIQAVVEFITQRGNELNESDISRTTQALLSAAALLTDKHLRQEVLLAICCLAETTSSKVVFFEVLASAGRDVATKDISRLRGGWPLQDSFYAFSQHVSLSVLFLEHLVAVLNQVTVFKIDVDREDTGVETLPEEIILHASVLALTSFFRGGGKIGKKAIEKRYASVLSSLILQLGSCHGLLVSGQQEPLWTLLAAFQSFCECMGDLEMGRILAKGADQTKDDKWIDVVSDLASCISIKRPKEVHPICLILIEALNRHQNFPREAAAAALSEFIRYCDSASSLMEQMVEALCLHAADESPTVRRVCLRGLVQIPSLLMDKYMKQVLLVIVSVLEDPDETVQSTVLQCLLTVLGMSSNDAVDPLLLNLTVKLRNLQMSMNASVRSNAFASFGALSKFKSGEQHDAFLEQVHVTLVRFILHVHDDDHSVRQACRKSFSCISTLVGMDAFSSLDTHTFNSDHRCDYEDFVRDVTRQLCQKCSSRADTYLASAIQAFDAPWPTIQANAIYCASSLLSYLGDHRSLAPFFTQVFGLLITRTSQSTDAIVRATSSSALGLLMKAANFVAWTTSKLDKDESSRKLQAVELASE